MENTQLSAQTAFVVHLTPVRGDCEGPNGGETLTGRVEHVSSGHSLRFSSMRQLVTFMRRALAASTVALLFTASPVSAAEQLIAGKKLLLKSSSTGVSLTHLAKNPAIEIGTGGDASDPRCSGAAGGGQSSIRLVAAGGDTDVTIPLPCTGWTSDAKNTSYSYRDRSGATCKLVQVKSGKLLKADCKGFQVAIEIDDTLAPVAVVTTLNTRQYCTSFGGTAVKDGSNGVSFLHKDAGAPAACPLLTSHTPTSIPTTTATPNATPSDTATLIATATATDTPIETPTPVSTATATNTTVDTPTPTATETATETPTITATATPTATVPPCNDPNSPILTTVHVTRFNGPDHLDLGTFTSVHLENHWGEYFDTSGNAANVILSMIFPGHSIELEVVDPGCASEYSFHWYIEVNGYTDDYTNRGITGYLTPRLTMVRDALPTDRGETRVAFVTYVTRLSDGRWDFTYLRTRSRDSGLSIEHAETCQHATSLCADPSCYSDPNACFIEAALPTTEPH